MDNLKIVFEWISIVFGGLVGLGAFVFSIAQLLGRNIIDEWFARKNQKYQVKLEAELAKYKSMLDSRLEVLKFLMATYFQSVYQYLKKLV